MLESCRLSVTANACVSSSELLFLSRTDIEDRLRASGLRAEKVYGDWQAKPFDAAVPEEMVFIVRAA
jgi:hypothetical protein